MTENTATLYINLFSSRCGACGNGVDPEAQTHEMVLGAWGVPGPGCGARFTEVSSDYAGTADRVKQMRPDLPFVGLDLGSAS